MNKFRIRAHQYVGDKKRAIDWMDWDFETESLQSVVDKFLYKYRDKFKAYSFNWSLPQIKTAIFFSGDEKCVAITFRKYLPTFVREEIKYNDSSYRFFNLDDFCKSSMYKELFNELSPNNVDLYLREPESIWS